jgi:hypothetical protein
MVQVLIQIEDVHSRYLNLKLDLVLGPRERKMIQEPGLALTELLSIANAQIKSYQEPPKKFQMLDLCKKFNSKKDPKKYLENYGSLPKMVENANRVPHSARNDAEFAVQVL